jgi:hypothetical protein
MIRSMQLINNFLYLIHENLVLLLNFLNIFFNHYVRHLDGRIKVHALIIIKIIY